MQLCIPMNEAKRIISSEPFEVLSFGLGDGTATALLRNTESRVLDHVTYLITALGDAACFLRVVGNQPL